MSSSFEFGSIILYNTIMKENGLLEATVLYDQVGLKLFVIQNYRCLINQSILYFVYLLFISSTIARMIFLKGTICKGRDLNFCDYIRLMI